MIYSGHWDHHGREGNRIFHGASDNAAGTAGVLELARAFRSLNPRPKRTIVFLWPTAEEKALTFEGGELQGEITGLNPDRTNPVGTYELEPNCTGTMSWQPNLNVPVFLRFAIVVVDNARQIKLAGSTGISQGEAVRK